MIATDAYAPGPDRGAAREASNGLGTGVPAQVWPSLHPLHMALIAFAAPLFLGGLLSDVAYARTYQIQWLNFAAWLIAGAMVFTGLALAWSAVGLLSAAGRRGLRLIGLLLLLATFVVGFLSSLSHARDAWASMPEGLVEALIATVLVLAALATGLWPASRGGRP